MSSGPHRGPPTPRPEVRPGPGQHPSGCQVRPEVMALLGPMEAAGLGRGGPPPFRLWLRLIWSHLQGDVC